MRRLQTTGKKLGWILWSQLTPDIADVVIDEQLAYFNSIGREFEWKAFSHDEPVDLKDRLAARGFELREPADPSWCLTRNPYLMCLTNLFQKTFGALRTPPEYQQQWRYWQGCGKKIFPHSEKNWQAKCGKRLTYSVYTPVLAT